MGLTRRPDEHEQFRAPALPDGALCWVQHDAKRIRLRRTNGSCGRGLDPDWRKSFRRRHRRGDCLCRGSPCEWRRDLWGTADGNWGASVTTADGTFERGLATECPSDTQNVDTIVAALIARRLSYTSTNARQSSSPQNTSSVERSGNRG